MPFQKGHKLATGRPKGSVNKTQGDIKDIISDIVSGQLPKIVNDLEDMTAKDRANTVINLVKYIVPVLKSAEVTNHNETVGPYTHEQLGDIVKNLKL